jgi:hypothetical protein
LRIRLQHTRTCSEPASGAARAGGGRETELEWSGVFSRSRPRRPVAHRLLDAAVVRRTNDGAQVVRGRRGGRGRRAGPLDGWRRARGRSRRLRTRGCGGPQQAQAAARKAADAAREDRLCCPGKSRSAFGGENVSRTQTTNTQPSDQVVAGLWWSVWVFTLLAARRWWETTSHVCEVRFLKLLVDSQRVQASGGRRGMHAAAAAE